MSSDDNHSNIVFLQDERGKYAVDMEELPDSEEVCTFIADMLDVLTQMASKGDHFILVYLLTMARIEALDALNKKQCDAE